MAEPSDAAPTSRITSDMSNTIQIKSKEKTKQKEFSVATFNVRGLTKDLKKTNLSTDIDRYNIDLCCLQETKIKNGCDVYKKKHRIICFPMEDEHYGMGFVINKRWETCIHKTWRVNDRLAVIQIKMCNEKKLKQKTPFVEKMEGLKMKIKLAKEKVCNRYRLIRRKLKLKFIKEDKTQRNLLTVINVYAPHSEITRKNPEEGDILYGKVEELIQKTRKETKLLIVSGDFNSEIGKRTSDDSCIGRFSSGIRNDNGQNLINFCEANDLLISNTCFQHSQKHRTTKEQTKIL